MKEISGKGKGRERRSAPQRAEWVERYRRSGLSRRAFVREHGIGLSTLDNWLREARGKRPEAAPVKWREVSWPAERGARAWAAELTLGEGTRLRLSEGTARSLLAPWLGVRSC